LHILEAYTNLYRIFNDSHLNKRIKQLISIFQSKIINAETGHLFVYFNKDWTPYANHISYGHDIETTWLLQEAAEVLGDKTTIKEVKESAVKLSETFLNEGVARHGGIYYEKVNGNLLEQFDWWVQAESVVGLFNSWQISGNEKFLQQAIKSWEFIREHIIDKKHGEWIWGVDANLKPVPNNKICHWKAPYHNSRMCLEMIKRIQKETL
jgi:mannobiose 2-epimerase